VGISVSGTSASSVLFSGGGIIGVFKSIVKVLASEAIEKGDDEEGIVMGFRVFSSEPFNSC